MKVVIQRVLEASVAVESNVIGKIGPGLLLLLGIQKGDMEEDADWLCSKILNLRIFGDTDGKMNLDIKNVDGEILIISQFTLIADYKKGNRPGFTVAASPSEAVPLYEYFKKQLASSGLKCESGKFGADMTISLVNDGPVTIVMDSKTKN